MDWWRIGEGKGVSAERRRTELGHLLSMGSKRKRRNSLRGPRELADYSCSAMLGVDTHGSNRPPLRRAHQVAEKSQRGPAMRVAGMLAHRGPRDMRPVALASKR